MTRRMQAQDRRRLAGNAWLGNATHGELANAALHMAQEADGGSRSPLRQRRHLKIAPCMVAKCCHLTCHKQYLSYTETKGLLLSASGLPAIILAATLLCILENFLKPVEQAWPANLPALALQRRTHTFMAFRQLRHISAQQLGACKQPPPGAEEVFSQGLEGGPGRAAA